MAKTATIPMTAEDEFSCDQIERNLADEREEWARRNPPRPRILKEYKALLHG